MKQLHRNQIYGNQIASNEGQQGFLCSNKVPYCCPSLDTGKFTYETINSLVELGKVLKQVREELVSEGYEIVDGKISKKLDTIKF
jgi:hypothetical protein